MQVGLNQAIAAPLNNGGFYAWVIGCNAIQQRWFTPGVGTSSSPGSVADGPVTSDQAVTRAHVPHKGEGQGGPGGGRGDDEEGPD